MRWNATRSSFVIQATNGTGAVRQFASKAARCNARAAFELCAEGAVGAGRRQSLGHRRLGIVPYPLVKIVSSPDRAFSVPPVSDLQARRSEPVASAPYGSRPCAKRDSASLHPCWFIRDVLVIDALPQLARVHSSAVGSRRRITIDGSFSIQIVMRQVGEKLEKFSGQISEARLCT